MIFEICTFYVNILYLILIVFIYKFIPFFKKRATGSSMIYEQKTKEHLDENEDEYFRNGILPIDEHDAENYKKAR